MDSHDSEPLLDRVGHHYEHNDESTFEHQIRTYRAQGRDVLSSRSKHFMVMAAVALDVASLLASIFIQLIACEMHQNDEPWVHHITEALDAVGLTISTLFMVELAVCLISFGPRYLSSWFHLIDSFVIVFGFVIEVTARGLTQSIGSLVVILRLWRLGKISEELMLGATERMEMLEQQLDDLHRENNRLKTCLGMDRLEE